MAETNSLLNCRTRLGYRGFESPLLRQSYKAKDVREASFFLPQGPGYSEVRLSRLLWEQEIPSSNLGVPTVNTKEWLRPCGRDQNLEKAMFWFRSSAG